MLKGLSDLFVSVGIHPIIGGFLLGILTCIAFALVKKAVGIEVHNPTQDELARFRDPNFSSQSTITTKMTFVDDGEQNSLPDHVATKVMQALREGKKIEAIKLFKDETGLGLKESKDIIEAMQRKLGL
jgi:hypothetical protein